MPSLSQINEISGQSPICHIITPVGMLGYGFDEQFTRYALEKYVPTGVPTAIILDSGSTDGGPKLVTLGTMTSPRSSYKKDLKKLLYFVASFNVPLIFSSAGGGGCNIHVDGIMEIIKEIAEEEGVEFNTITILSEITKALVSERLDASAISGCGKAVPPLTRDDIDSSPRIVCQMGPEPFMQAMENNPDFNVLVGGRAYDPAPYIAYAAWKSSASTDNTSSEYTQKLWGGFTHMGKIMECGGVCSLPKSAGAVATVYTDGSFDITPLDPKSKCTPLSVAAHTLYEKSRPDILYGPGGYLDLTKAEYKQLPNKRTVRVRGAIFKFSQEQGVPYQVKMEAGKVVGFRTMYLGHVKDPFLINQMDDFLQRVKAYVFQQHSPSSGTWDLGFNIYGQNNGEIQSRGNHVGEVFLVGEALASTQELATSVASTARIATIHGPYEGQKATAGNFGHGIGGASVIELGKCSQFSIYHLLDLKEGEEGATVCDPNQPDDIAGMASGALFRQYNRLVGLKDRSKKGDRLPIITPTPPSDKKPGNDLAAANHIKEKPRFPQQPTLGDVASIIRSKNSGPYEITFDIMFDKQEVYNLIKQSGLLSVDVIAILFHISREDVIYCGYFEQALAFKATIPRMRNGKCIASGGFLEDDVHGAQRYLPLLEMKLPEALATSIKAYF